jgi:hypothetical protein
MRRKTRQKADNGLRPEMRTHLKPLGFWVTTVETGLVTQGVPDFNYMVDGGIEGWVECKATDGWAVVFKPMQVGWHERRYRMGGRSWIAVRRQTKGGPRQGPSVDELYMVPGSCVIVLRDEGLNIPQARYMGEGGPTCWDWQEVRRLLVGRIVGRGK